MRVTVKYSSLSVFKNDHSRWRGTGEKRITMSSGSASLPLALGHTVLFYCLVPERTTALVFLGEVQSRDEEGLLIGNMRIADGFDREAKLWLRS